MIIRIATASALALCVPTVCMAGDAHDKSLTIGDKAPTTEISHWLKGKEVTEFEDGNVYVMEFWATWCGPCKVSIPHISELQEQYADYDVTFIGVSDEKLQTVVKFLSTADSENVMWTEKIHYTLATDPDRSTAKAYMKAAAQQGIPTAFIVGKDSRIEWIGHPMDIDDVLAQVVRDNWDRDTFKVTFEEEVAPVRKALKAQARVDAAVERGDWDGAIKAVNALVEAQPKQVRYKFRLFRKMLHKEPALAYGYGRDLMKENWDKADLLNQLAWFTVDDEDVTTRDLEFAMEAATQACKLTDDEDAGVLDTLARVYFEIGDVKTAIKWQRKAVEEAEGKPLAGQLREVLIKYEKVVASGI